jgi:ribosomal protein RSM22 (predicted rRNA methylase)
MSNTKQHRQSVQQTIVRKNRIIAHVPVLVGGVVIDVKFVAAHKQVTAKCKGHPRIIVRRKRDGSFVACAEDGSTSSAVVEARTPKKAFARAVKAWWN